MVLERLKSKLDTIQEDIAEHEPEEFGLYWHDTKRVKDVEHLVDDFNNLEKLGFSSLPMRRWHVFLLKTVLAAYLGDEAKEQQLARLDQNEIDSLRTFLDLLLLNLKRWKTDGLGSGLLKKYGFPMVQYREVAVFLAKNRSKFIEALVDRVDDEEQTQFIFTEALAASAEANVFQKPALTEEFLLELMAKFPLDGIYDLFLKGFPACSRAGLLNKDYLTVDEILKLNAEKFRSLNDEIRDYRGGVLGWLAKRKYALVMFALLSLTACGKKESSQSSPKASAAVVVQVEELNGDEKGLLNVLNRYTYVKPFVFGYKGKIRGVDKKILNDAQGLSYDAKKLPNSKAGDAALIWFVKEKPTRQRVEVLRAITTDTNKRFLFEDFSSRESMIQDYQLLYEHMSGSLELHPNIKPFLGNPKELDVDILVQALKLQSEHPDLCGKLPAMGKTYRPLDVVFACLEKEWKSEHIVQFFGSVNKLIQKDAYRHLWTMDFSDDQWSNRLSTISPLQVVERDWDSAKWDLMAKIVTVYSVRPSSLRTTDEAAIMAFSERFPKLEATFTLAQLNQRLDLIVGLYGIRPRVITNLLEDVIAAKEMQGIVLSHLDDAQPYWLSPNGIKAQVELRKRIEQGKTGKELFDATGPLTIVLHATDDLNGAFESDGSSWDRYPDNNHRFVFVNVSTDKQILSSLEKYYTLTKEKFDYIVIAGHGKPGYIRLGKLAEQYTNNAPFYYFAADQEIDERTEEFLLKESEKLAAVDEVLLDRRDTDIVPQIKQFRKKNAKVIVVACSGAKGSGGVLNNVPSISKFIAKQAETTVFGATDVAYNSDLLIFNDNNEITAVVFFGENQGRWTSDTVAALKKLLEDTEPGTTQHKDLKHALRFIDYDSDSSVISVSLVYNDEDGYVYTKVPIIVFEQPRKIKLASNKKN